MRYHQGYAKYLVFCTSRRVLFKIMHVLVYFLACQRGYYKEGYVPEPCKPCPQNRTTSIIGASNSSDCHPLPGRVISVTAINSQLATGTV